MSSKIKTTGALDESTPTLLPKLRFPEFREARDWDATTLGELSEVVRGGSPRPIDGYITTSADGLSWLKIGDVDKDAKYVTHTAEKVRAEALSKTRVANPGDLVLSNSMSFGRPYILQIATCINDGWIAITKISEKINRDFIYYLISASGSQSYLVDRATGSGVLNLNVDIIRGIRVCFPSLPEQQKIAECLSSVDDLVAAQAQKLDALKTHKIGLMQQLFPREGETQPRARFPEFQNAGEWVEKKLEDLAKRGGGHTPNKSHPEYYSGGIKWISLADSKRFDCGLISGTTIEISEKGVQNSSAILHPKGTVVISRDAGVGKSAVMGVPMAVSQHFITWTCKSNLLSNWFLYHLLQNFKPLFERAATGSTIKTIELNFFIELAFPVPMLNEQQRIADCLNNLDDLIAVETQKLEALKRHKKGLMQILFPIPEKIES